MYSFALLFGLFVSVFVLRCWILFAWIYKLFTCIRFGLFVNVNLLQSFCQFVCLFVCLVVYLFFLS